MKRWLQELISVITSIIILLVPNFAWPQTSSEQSETPTTVIILRHGEKAGPSGNVDLSNEGKQRAQILAYVCGSSGISALYGVTDKDNDKRVRQTLKPIAKHVDIEPTILMDPMAISRCAHEIRNNRRGKVVLVVSHAGTVQEIIKKLGGDEKCCLFGADEYDNLCIVTMTPSSPVCVLRLKYGAIK